MSEAEQTVFGFDHARFGGALMNKWSFPSTLVAAVMGHHVPDMNEGFDEPLTVHLADIIANAWGMSTSSQFPLMPLSTETWDALGLSPGDLAPMLIELEHSASSSGQKGSTLSPFHWLFFAHHWRLFANHWPLPIHPLREQIRIQ